MVVQQFGPVYSLKNIKKYIFVELKRREMF